ncbi:hypothetical protein D1867_12170 [Acidianus infernus]|uniref:Uncharacterized protein n=1 Tax=Acidianus infernus TaxID=12915 RepID=A0A6A9QL35_ACIIN|nr:hypothetical protein [Acidianus infernus]MUM65966.1 hypothetical protein [Acidianus infernus]
MLWEPIIKLDFSPGSKIKFPISTAGYKIYRSKRKLKADVDIAGGGKIVEYVEIPDQTTGLIINRKILAYYIPYSWNPNTWGIYIIKN